MGSCVDAGLWRACAGNMVHVPLVNSKVVYFPQGHAEHANGVVNFRKFPEIPAMVSCRVDEVTLMADDENDEVYLRMKLMPLERMEFMGQEENGLVKDGEVKSASFSKILTQSDANNGGGFSVPKSCAELIFPELNYAEDPPVQTLYIKDVHGTLFDFRHIYRGTPRRHLLTTGWTAFVNSKMLVAGDTVVFFKAENGELFVGTRRAKRGIYRVNPPSRWSPGGGSSMTHGKVSVETVIETAKLAAAGREFEVDYYPHAGSPEFCVKASAVNAALRTQWCAGMKFKMAFETENATKVSWFHGTVEAAQAVGPISWPDSPWRLLQVRWDEPNSLPTSLANVDRVSPWLVDFVVSCIPSMQMVPYSLAMKKLRTEEPLNLPPNSPPPSLLYPEQFIYIPNMSCGQVADSPPVGIQGARHVQPEQFPPIFQPAPQLQLQPHLVPPSAATPTPQPVGINFTGHRNEDMPEKSAETAASAGFLLFGKRIFTEQEMSKSSSAAKPASDSITLSDGNKENMENAAGSSGSHSVEFVQNGDSPAPDSSSPQCDSQRSMDPRTFGGLEKN